MDIFHVGVPSFNLPASNLFGRVMQGVQVKTLTLYVDSSTIICG